MAPAKKQELQTITQFGLDSYNLRDSNHCLSASQRLSIGTLRSFPVDSFGSDLMQVVDLLLPQLVIYSTVDGAPLLSIVCIGVFATEGVPATYTTARFLVSAFTHTAPPASSLHFPNPPSRPVTIDINLSTTTQRRQDKNPWFSNIIYSAPLETCGNQSARDITKFCGVFMDA